MNDTLTITDLILLADILSAAERNTRVRWSANGDPNATAIVGGVARSIGHKDFNFLGADDDVRDGFLRVSGTFEHALAVRDVIAWMRAGLFVVDFE